MGDDSVCAVAEKHAVYHNGGGEQDDPGCRPCCSTPYGRKSVATSVCASIAWVFSITSMNTCHYLGSYFTYCHPAPAQAASYGTCGACHCINGDEPCPTGAGNVPITEYPKNFTEQLNAMTITNPMGMACNPYNATSKGNRSSCTDPPQELYQVELWETAVCGIKYDMGKLTDDLCPTDYNITTYDSEDEMTQDGAIMTHWGACGVCSTTIDLAVYIDSPDLTGKGQECGVRGLIDVEDGIKCFQETGYTRPCAEMWMYNVFNTRDHCFDVCVDFTFFGDGQNNGPPPECRIANCLLCDEQMSGPIFQTEAARSRRRSGLLSKIARPCENILIVNHTHPCDVTRAEVERRRRRLADVEALSAVLESVRPTAPPKWPVPAETETCVYMQLDLGLLSYAGFTSNNFFDDDLFLSGDAKTMTSRYETCYQMELRNSVDGFWYYMSEILGGAHTAAKAFSIVSTVVGFVAVMFAWTTMCFTYPPKFWRGVAILFGLCSLCDFLTLLYFASGVCELGCSLEQGAAYAIVAGLFWAASACLSAMTGPFKTGQATAACCCCPDTIDKTGAQPGAYLPVPTADDPPAVTEVSVVETERSDGTVVVETTTTLPNGGKTIEVTTKKRQMGSGTTEAAETRETEFESEPAEAAIKSTAEKEAFDA